MHSSGSVVDGHRPVVAGDIPVELVMVFEEARSIAYAVNDFNRARGVDGVGDENLQIAVCAGGRRLILKFAAATVGDTGDVDEQFVVSAIRPRIFYWDSAVNAVPLPDKNQV